MLRRTLVPLFSLALAACGVDAEAPGESIRSEKNRIMSPAVSGESVDAVVFDNMDFGWEMYRSAVAADPFGNTVFSPYSLFSAFGMLYAGAGGNTQTQMADGFRFGGRESTEFHAAMNAIELALPESGDWGILRVANDLWVQNDFDVKTPYLDTLAENYGSGMHGMDFVGDAEAATDLINLYISDVTEGKIPTLFGPNSLNAATRLALTNAIYFKSSWKDEFKPEDTRDADFHRLDGSTVQAQMMNSTESFYYGEEPGRYQAVEIQYKNEDLAMLIVMPDEGTLGDFEASMDASELASVTGAMAAQEVVLGFPKFELNTTLDTLKEELEALGMSDMFNPGAADFSGIADVDLFVQSVVHKAYILVNEEGTEAAAATGISTGVTSAPPPPVTMTVDKPFLYFIRHLPTGNCLFMGRVVDPTAE